MSFIMRLIFMYFILKVFISIINSIVEHRVENRAAGVLLEFLGLVHAIVVNAVVRLHHRDLLGRHLVAARNARHVELGIGNEGVSRARVLLDDGVIVDPGYALRRPRQPRRDERGIIAGHVFLVNGPRLTSKDRIGGLGCWRRSETIRMTHLFVESLRDRIATGTTVRVIAKVLAHEDAPASSRTVHCDNGKRRWHRNRGLRTARGPPLTKPIC